MNHEILTNNRPGSAPAFFSYQPERPGPLVVIVPSIFGVTEDVEHYARWFSAEGALVYAMDPFTRDGQGPLRIPQDSAAAKARMGQISEDLVLKDLLATCARGLADEKCNGNLVLLGVCFGGRFVVKASQHLQPHGIAVWHGAGLTSEIDAERLSDTELSFDFGEDDPLIPLSDVDALRVSTVHLNATIRVHAQCGHGFTHWGTEKCVRAAAEIAADAVVHMIHRLTPTRKAQ
ncbi:MAG: dienelactone hydrolase family protein [Myxococcota bacterium]|nr:dienelactone hydrolase family protein [Myxococcota bacterium]